MFIPMYIASLEQLSKDSLVKVPHSPAFNVSTITRLLIEFLQEMPANFEIEKVYEIIKAADEHGVSLELIEGIAVSGEDIEVLRNKRGWVRKGGVWRKSWKIFKKKYT